MDALPGVPTESIVGIAWGKMEEPHDRFRDESRHLPLWDYSSAGNYFITICTQFKMTHFGKIEEDTMKLSPVGEIVKAEWIKTGSIRENVELDEFVIMPNHFHSIVILNTVVGTPRWGVHNNKPVKPVSLGTVIGQFKSACTKRIRVSGFKDFGWQARFYDHVIRDEIDLNRIRKYIQENPLKWALDEYYSEEWEPFD